MYITQTKIKELEAFMNQAHRCPEAVIVLTADADAEKKLGAFQGFRTIIEKKKTRRDSVMEVKAAFEKHSLPCDYGCADENIRYFRRRHKAGKERGG
ncbi:MAG: hypothetical protein LRY51_15865 [Geovibrio sp.]|nr:hypothetical protein [Geovibrio sp.]